MRGSWLVVAALPAELPRGLGRDESLRLQAIGRIGGASGTRATGDTGMGGDAGTAVRDLLRSAGASALVITGTCGALREGTRIGSLVAPARVVLPGGGELEPDPVLRGGLLSAAASLGLRVECGRLVQARELVDAARHRADLSRAEDASFVDMESASWALEARRLGVPWAVLRIISDSPERPLAWLSEVLGAAGMEQPSAARVGLGVARRPWHLPRLLMLAHRVRGGRAATGAVLRLGRAAP